MSAVIKTATPFIDRECLCQALSEIGCNFRVQGDTIITDRIDARLGFQEFRKDQYGKYVLLAYSYMDRNQADFVKTIEKQYNLIYQNKLAALERLRLEAIEVAERKRIEAEQIRLENERKAFVEKQRETIVARAKEQGYSVKEENVKGKIKLVLVRNTY